MENRGIKRRMKKYQVWTEDNNIAMEPWSRKWRLRCPYTFLGWYEAESFLEAVAMAMQRHGINEEENLSRCIHNPSLYAKVYLADVSAYKNMIPNYRNSRN